MSILKSFLQHIFMAATFRHDFRGLPRTESLPVFLIFFVSSLATYARWMDPSRIITFFGILLVVTMITSPRFGVMVAMTSIAVDLTAGILSPVVPVDAPIYSAWEYAATLYYFFKHQKISHGQVA